MWKAAAALAGRRGCVAPGAGRIAAVTLASREGAPSARSCAADTCSFGDIAVDLGAMLD